MTTKTLARPRKLSANEAFCKAELEFDTLMARLKALRASHFGVDVDVDRNWGEAGSVGYVNDRLKEALEHYGNRA